ncbi:hypothetical protein FDB28_05910 [Clostridium botulinum]|nr:hypothetical protein [Clostridium botulinum]NFS95395.1 hypothetical protein [Clostridium botulinum]
MDLREEDIDISKDKMIIEVPIIIQGKRANGTAIGNEISVHNAKLYVNKDGNYYYIFEYRVGRAVMNFIPEDYMELEKIIPISKITIFQKDGNLISKIPFEYR